MHRETGVECELAVGARGQFDVLLDGERIAARGAGFFTRLLGGGWPDADDVVAIVKEKQVLAGG